MSRKIVLPGGSGFLGRALAGAFAGSGWDVVVLSRREAPAAGTIRTVRWDGRAVGDWAGELDGAEAVINLTGRSVACRHTPENRREILESRIQSVQAVRAAMARCRRPPNVLVQASSVGIYGNAGDRMCDETAPHDTGFLADVAEVWERAFFSGSDAGGPRRAALRIGLVLGRDGGPLEPLAKLARWYLGGAAGNGRQYISWIHLEDFCAMCRWVIDRPESQGAYNATGSAPVTNAEFMREVRRALGRPWSPPAPVWAVKLVARFAMRVDSSLALGGCRCAPRRLQEEGFRFAHPDLAATLRDLLGAGPPATPQKKV